MLVETRDTITVPAQIMIRILASLHQYRRLMHASGGSAFGMENRRNRRDAVRVAMNAENAGVVAVAVDRNNDNAANDDIDNENEDNDDSDSNHNSNNSNAT